MSIADWLQGTRDRHGRLVLSSRKLLNILERLPDSSQFKTWALRDGDWTHDQDVAAKTHNEVAAGRAFAMSSKGVEGDDVLYYPFRSPSELRDLIDEQADDESVAADLMSSMFGD